LIDGLTISFGFLLREEETYTSALVSYISMYMDMYYSPIFISVC